MVSACAWLALAFSAAIHASAAIALPSRLELRPGQETTFTVQPHRGQLIIVNPRGSMLGHAAPKVGEITAGFAPAHGQGSYARLHVFERLAQPITVHLLVFQGHKAPTVDKLCAPTDMDAWVMLPSSISRIELTLVQEPGAQCTPSR